MPTVLVVDGALGAWLYRKEVAVSDLRRELIEAGAEAIKTEWSNGGSNAEPEVLTVRVLDAMLDKLEEHAAAVPEFDSLPAAYVVSVLREKPEWKATARTHFEYPTEAGEKP